MVTGEINSLKTVRSYTVLILLFLYQLNCSIDIRQDTELDILLDVEFKI